MPIISKQRTRLTVALVGAICLLLIGWYVLDRAKAHRANDQPLIIPIAEHRPGTVRLDHGVWVARQPTGVFYVFQNRDPHKGQPLNWDAATGLFMQAASYRMDGSCVEGPCNSTPEQALYRVESRLDGQNLVLYPNRVISGRFRPEPTWVSELKLFFRRMSRN
jgi:nitrite reductase/ring-hydroxylating ferredoxin subunit